MLYLVSMLAPRYLPDGLECGCDEAGRGCLAGPVVAAAVILPDAEELERSTQLSSVWEVLRDSKKLPETERDRLRLTIESDALAWAVAFVWPEEIDRINILQASFQAMHRAVGQLAVVPDRLLIDGNRFVPYLDIPHHTFVKGDDRFLSIAAASILAKTHRDAYMKALDVEFPGYGWATNKGYPTKAHRDHIREFGVTKYHRRSFALFPGYVQGELFEGGKVD